MTKTCKKIAVGTALYLALTPLGAFAATSASPTCAPRDRGGDTRTAPLYRDASSGGISAGEIVGLVGTIL